MPRRRLQLDLFYHDVFLGRVSTGHFRPDVRQAGLGDGHAGFVFHLPPDVPDDIDKADLCVATSGPSRQMLPEPASAVANDHGRPLPVCHRRMLGAYLAMLRDAPVGERAGGCGPRPRIDALCAPAGAVSAFVEHIALKHERGELRSPDATDLWRWYIGSYAMEHGGRLAPLSREDIERLAGPGGRSRTSARALFVDEIRGRGREATYRWAIETSRRLRVEDCLVAPRAAAALRSVSLWQGLAAYPLSAFMRKARREIAILAQMPIGTPAERRRLYVLFMILALRDPHLLIYMPHEWLRRLVDEKRTFETTQAELFGAEGAIAGDRYRALLAAVGFDLAKQTFEPRFYDGHRVRGGAIRVTSEHPVDVQIFGPLSRRLGLGESGRRIAAALEITPFSLNVVDYDIGNASRTDQIHGLRFGAPRAARLNILHLNAEEIPEAIAYLPDVFADVPLVAIPYWELNRPAAAHRLGLRTIDEIWVASRFLADVFADAGKPVHWIGMSASAQPVPSAAARAAIRARYGFAADTFVFLTTSDALSWAQRKNPLGVVEAFCAAFPEGEDVALVVKTQNLDGPLTPSQTRHWGRIRALCDADPRITLINESFDAATQRTLLAACDGFVSLHRAEGLGLDAIDALALGRAVVATAYSGTMDLCTPATSWPVAAEIVPVAARDYCFVEAGHVWAEPSPAAACAALRGVVFDRAARERRVAAGQALVREQASAAACARRLEARVHALLSARTGSTIDGRS